MKKDYIDIQKSLYRSNFLKHGDCAEGTYQNSDGTTLVRYENLLKHIPKHGGFSIHDVGCGICDLYKFISDKKYDFDYSGTEIVDEMIGLSLNKYPGLRIYNRNILEDEVDEKYDFIVQNGVFNLKGEVDETDWEKYCLSMIEKMFSMCTKGIVFNFITKYCTFFNENLFYYDPSIVFDFCMKNLSRFVCIDHCYPLYEYTVTVFKKEFVQEQFDSPAFEKYFRN